MSTLTDYAAEFQELLDDCKRAKPNPIIHNPEQKFNSYIHGLRRANMDEKHIDTEIAMKIYDWERSMNFWCITKKVIHPNIFEINMDQSKTQV